MSQSETEIRPYYFLLGKKFKVHHIEFLGPAYVSPEAIYARADIVPYTFLDLFLKRNKKPIALFGPGRGGKPGEDQDRFSGTGEAYDCDLSDLPEEITAHPEWPWRGRRKGRVFVLPRQLVHHAGLSVWGHLFLDTTAFRLRVDVSMFRVGRVRRYLAQTG